ncbi:MAG: peroxiredoxin Q/BCP, partial [Marivirga sp.]
AEFLVDKNLEIRKVYYSKSLTDRLDIKLIQKFADDSSIFDDEKK